MDKCNGCAFLPGTDASQSQITMLKANLCVEANHPFYCHQNALPDGTLPQGQEKLCQGFLEAVEVLRAKGFYESEPEWRRRVRAACLQVIDDYENSIERGQELSEAEINAAVAGRIAGILV